MMSLAGRLLWIALAGALGSASGQTILWNSDANAINETSTGALMDAGFRFEFGVFNDGFIPTAVNVQEWSANWHASRRTPYDAVNKRYSNSFTPSNNNAPFSIGKDAYVWGFRGDPAAGEWILFRAAAWDFPDAEPFVPPPPIEWFAKHATAIVGSIQITGSPYLMKSAAVTNAAPPTTTWSQWQAENLTGEPLDEPGDDPDGDGTSNLLEFVFGTPPRTAGSKTTTPVTLSGGHVSISIPRRIDHAVTLIVEVSGDLVNWSSGPLHTEVLSDDVAALVVRDLTALDASNPKRFIRLRAVLP